MKYTIYWLDGKKQEVEGKDIAKAWEKDKDNQAVNNRLKQAIKPAQRIEVW